MPTPRPHSGRDHHQSGNQEQQQSARLHPRSQEQDDRGKQVELDFGTEGPKDDIDVCRKVILQHQKVIEQPLGEVFLGKRVERNQAESGDQ